MNIYNAQESKYSNSNHYPAVASERLWSLAIARRACCPCALSELDFGPGMGGGVQEPVALPKLRRLGGWWDAEKFTDERNEWPGGRDQGAGRGPAVALRRAASPKGLVVVGVGVQRGAMMMLFELGRR
ncbi:unnamed protein product [Bursaphelenchus xylophilus]|uniref:(pine wood nematode) hypothetical protein n=1 Tax=Bursaphelenchus xylophilus TaxID=6326 RepID=A0A1I7RZC4_BURXY|nr:unnamed protein product [Bursaphelenchus xylophilus]CAG9106612.1 unnamed protein product [Bursaphelenchus xylophilus]